MSDDAADPGHPAEPDDAQLDDLARRFRTFADEVFADYCPLYERISAGIATDRDLLTIAAATRPGQPVPNILFSAVKFLMLGGTAPEHPIHAMYASASLDRDAQPTDAFEVFRDFALAHRDELHLQVAFRTVQTNEVGRCAVWLPAAAVVAARSGEPLSWLEVGASAGLNLRWPHYRYEYAGADRAYGAADSPVVIRSQWRGDHRPQLPDDVPGVRAAVGLDLHRVDLADPDSGRWLQSLVWPGHADREDRLRAAIAEAVADPPRVVEGHALTWLRRLDELVPADGPLTVVHSFVLNQFTPAERDAFHARLADESHRRPVVRLGMEHVRDMTAELRLTAWRDGREASDEHLADCHPHGHWIEWQADT